MTKEHIYQLIEDADKQLKANNRIQAKILLEELRLAIKELYDIEANN